MTNKNSNELLVHNVKAGPFDDDEGNIWSLCLVERDGKLYDEEVYFATMKDAIIFADHFKHKIEPIVLGGDENEQ